MPAECVLSSRDHMAAPEQRAGGRGREQFPLCPCYILSLPAMSLLAWITTFPISSSTNLLPHGQTALYSTTNKIDIHRRMPPITPTFHLDQSVVKHLLHSATLLPTVPSCGHSSAKFFITLHWAPTSFWFPMVDYSFLSEVSLERLSPFISAHALTRIIQLNVDFGHSLLRLLQSCLRSVLYKGQKLLFTHLYSGEI